MSEQKINTLLDKTGILSNTLLDKTGILSNTFDADTKAYTNVTIDNKIFTRLVDDAIKNNDLMIYIIMHRNYFNPKLERLTLQKNFLLNTTTRDHPNLTYEVDDPIYMNFINMANGRIPK